MMGSFRATLCCGYLVLCLATTVSGQTMESVYELDVFHTAQVGSERKQIARYWIDFAGDQSRENFFSFPPPPVDTTSFEYRLRAELRPLTELGEQYQALPPGDERDAVYQQYQEMASSDEFAEQLFQFMGPEYCQGKVVEKFTTALATLRERQQLQLDQLASGLEYEPLANTLKLSTKQKAKIREELESAGQEFKEQIGKLLNEVSKASNDRWKRLLRLLDAEQKEFAQTRIGKPAEWFRAIRTQQWRQYVYEHYAADRLVESMHDEVDRTERGIALNPPPEDVPIVEQLVHKMIGDEVIWGELELVSRQQDELRPIATWSSGKIMRLTVMPKKRFNDLLNATFELPKVVEDILLPDQLEWFRQIEFQIRTEPKYDSTVGLLDPRVVKHLKLNDDQQKEMKVIGDEFAETLRTSTEKINAEKKRIEEELDSKLADLLDEEQLVLYRKFTKAPTPKDDRKKESGDLR